MPAKLRKKVDFKKHFWRINVESSQIKGNQGKNEEVQFWAEYKFGRNKEVVRFLIRNPNIMFQLRLVEVVEELRKFKIRTGHMWGQSA